jgi:hypothetical protein
MHSNSSNSYPSALIDRRWRQGWQILFHPRRAVNQDRTATVLLYVSRALPRADLTPGSWGLWPFLSHLAYHV